MDIQHLSSAALRKRRHKLAHGLPPIEQVLRGSLSETYKRCGRPNCHCMNGRPRRDYVPNNAYPQATQLIANFRKLRDALDEIGAINAELLRRREEIG